MGDNKGGEQEETVGLRYCSRGVTHLDHTRGSHLGHPWVTHLDHTRGSHLGHTWVTHLPGGDQLLRRHDVDVPQSLDPAQEDMAEVGVVPYSRSE